MVGNVICFNTPSIASDSHACQWNSSNENALTINKQTGYAIAKSEQTNVIVTYQCSEDLKIVTTTDIYAVQKVNLLKYKVMFLDHSSNFVLSAGGNCSQ